LSAYAAAVELQPPVTPVVDQAAVIAHNTAQRVAAQARVVGLEPPVGEECTWDWVCGYVPGGGVTITIGFVLLGFGWYFLGPQGSGEPQVSISSLVESPVAQRPFAQDLPDAVGKGLTEVVPSTGADELPTVGPLLDAVGKGLMEAVPAVCVGIALAFLLFRVT
jgi:hypothetical protein